jgi:branched-chain amino acid transport system substrate-binding protein
MPSRRWSAALVAAGLVTGTLAACSSPGDSNNDNNSSSSQSSGPFKIGVIIPISGPLATTSTVYQAVAKNLGTDKIPGTSTIDGRKVQVIVRDDLGTGPGTSSAVRQLLDSDKVDAIIGPLYTTEAETALPLIKKANILDISLSGCPQCGDGSAYPTTFSVESDRPSQMPPTVARMKELGITKVAMLQADDASGTAYADAFNAEAKSGGIDVVTTVHFATASVDLGTQAAKLKSSGAQAVYLATAVPSDVANAAKAMKEASYQPYVFGNAAAAVDIVSEAAGADWVKKWASSGYGKNATRPDPAPQATQFAKTMEAIVGKAGLAAPINLSAGVLDAFNLIKRGVEGAHSSAGDKAATWLEQNGYPEGIKANYSFTDTQHNGMKADQQALVQPGTNVDGIPLRAGASG